jgi:hypothetical protein
MIYVESKKKSMKTLLQKYPNATILDITSKGKEPWVRISPFYPHGGIPIPPYPSNDFSMSVEGIWQGLKVFELEDIDTSKFEVQNMKGLKRTVRKFGKPLGHRKGVHGTELLDYLTARKEIYLRAYGWLLDNKANDVIQLLKAEAEKNDLVLLDFDTNGEIENTEKPLSHAALVKRYLEKKYPELANLNFNYPKLKKESEKKSDNKLIAKQKRNTQKNFTEEEIKEIIRLYRNKHSLQTLQDKYKASKDKIKQVLEKNNVPIRGKSNKKKNSVNQLSMF